jgi:hypothetical protein
LTRSLDERRAVLEFPAPPNPEAARRFNV